MSGVCDGEVDGSDAYVVTDMIGADRDDGGGAGGYADEDKVWRR